MFLSGQANQLESQERTGCKIEREASLLPSYALHLQLAVIVWYAD
jgi:hypothetical protein